MVITTKLRTFTVDGITRAILLQNPALEIGSITGLKINKSFLGNFRLISVESLKLKDLIDFDLSVFSPAYRTVSFVWKTLEAAYGAGLPGDHVIYIASFRDPAVAVPEVPVVTTTITTTENLDSFNTSTVTVDLEDLPAPNNLEDIFETPVILPEALEELEDDTPRFEKIRSRKKKSWDDE